MQEFKPILLHQTYSVNFLDKDHLTIDGEVHIGRRRTDKENETVFLWSLVPDTGNSISSTPNLEIVKKKSARKQTKYEGFWRLRSSSHEPRELSGKVDSANPDITSISEAE